MKTAYVTIFDPSDGHAWSALGVYVLSGMPHSRSIGEPVIGQPSGMDLFGSLVATLGIVQPAP